MSHITFRTLHGVRIISLLAIILLFLTATFTVTHPVAADGDRIQVSGTLTTHFISSGCTSPLGICEGGSITGNYLNGTVFGQFSSISFIPNETNPTSIEYTGTATITTKFGTLSGDVHAIQQLPGDTLHLFLTITTGTKRYKSIRGLLDITELQPGTDEQEHFVYVGWLTRNGDSNSDN